MRKNAGEMKDMDKNAPGVLPPPAANGGAKRGAASATLKRFSDSKPIRTAP
jgi:hypothetical protein